MKVWMVAIGISIGLAASARAQALAASSGGAGFVAPGETLVLDGIPPIPRTLAAEVNRYAEFRSASFASWHPERREMLISTRFANVPQVHHVAFPGGARRQLTFFAEPVGGGSYQPRHGRFFVFTKDQGGDEFYQVYRFDIESGRETLLTDGVKRHSLGPWSNAGDWLAYQKVDVDGEGAFTELRAIRPEAPETARVIATLRGGGWSVSDWSPDDAALLAREYISINESNLWLVDVKTGQTKRLTPEQTNEKIAWGGGVFAKEEKAIYTTSDAGGEFSQLTYLDLATRETKNLSANIPWDVSGLDPSPDGKTLAFVANEAGVSKLHLLDTGSGKEKLAPEMPIGVFGGVEWHNNGRDLGFTLSSARSSADAYSVDVESGKVERWTESETGGLNTAAFAEPEIVRWKSFDGLEITGFLYRPAAKFAGKRPVIVNIHGGPEGQSRPTFLGSTNYYINELGVGVIYPNVRGSSGYGKTFLKLDNASKREDTYKDIEGLLDWIAKDEGLNAERVMVTGGSYGGHMTLAVSTYYSDRIRCAVDVVGISNLRTFLENTQGYRQDLRRAEYGDERDPEMRRYLDRIAPLNNAEKIRKPLLVIQGANDPRVPKSESDQIVETLKRAGTPVWYLVGKDEGHGFRKKSNVDFQFQSTVMFVKEHLLN